ncbi:MAG: PSD1 domain-containing protein [Verrucomicrobiae bacterium]|nr:PSD1 domain-containing protein [Verrucomicrobiae bacterium]
MIVAFLASATFGHDLFAAETKVDFNRDIRPILSDKCFKCHGPDGAKRKADLRLDTREGVLDSGTLEPGKPESSELVERVFSDDPDELMPPPDSKLALKASEKEILRRWIAEGAAYQGHWAYEPIPATGENTPPPAETWADRKNAIDDFVHARLKRENLSPSPEADRRTLVRRVTLDLIGLPPTPAEVEAFVNDRDPDAYGKLVDRLLQSKHYGERMALPWLDAARYADSNGFQQDGDRHQYIWRDWVVRAMNDNLPFDQFTTWQLAGDLLENPTRDQLIATGFNRNHMLNGEGGAIAEEQRNNYVFDRVDTTATTWLGLTMACAQCHDHKFDPLTNVDYYRFFAYFNNLPETGRVDKRLGRIQVAEPTMNLASPEQEAREKELNRDIAARDKLLKAAKTEIDQAVRAWWDAGGIEAKSLPEKTRPLVGRPFEAIVPSEQRLLTEYFIKQQKEKPEWAEAQREKEKFEADRDALRREIPVVMVMREQEGERRPTHVLKRGDYLAPGDPVEPATPAALTKDSAKYPPTRLGLAEWLLASENPLTARVIVNRYWQTFFGIGLVKTAEDFGVQGEAPSHPQLLDWLAATFRESGWDVKALHRLIVTSATYRQSSRVSPELVERDPENRLLARGARFRLPSMLIRDQALALSGLLNPQIGGRPVYPYQPPGLWEEFSYEKFGYTPDHGEKLYRRSLYIFWRRTLGPTTLFDTANRQTCLVKPLRTNTPLHALITLNDPAYVEAARVWAEAILREGVNDPAASVSWAYRRATGHSPTDTQTNLLTGTYRKARDHFGSYPDEAKALLAVGETPPDPKLDPTEIASYAQVAQLILNLDEVLVRE